MRYIFDIETDGLLDELTCIHSLVLLNIDTGEMLSCPPDKYAFVMTIEEGLRELMNADLIVGHNIIKFDIPAIQKLYPWFQPKGAVRDTIVCTRLIYTNLKERDFAYRNKHPEFPTKLIGKHALEAWGHRLGEYKGDFKGPWTNWSEEMQSYCEQDTRVTYRLWSKLQAKNYSEQAIQLEHDFAQILFKQEQRGFHFDTEAGRKLYAELCKKRLDLEEQLKAIFPAWEERTPFTPKVNNAKRGYQKGVTIDKVKVVEFNPNSRDHIANRLQMLRGWKPSEFTEDGKPKVDETVLEKLDWPEAKLLAEYLMIQKRIGQLAEGAQAWLKLEQNGRIHGQVVTNGAVTGRCTHKYPNITQVPAKGVPYGVECRSLFQPSPGFVLLGCDASGLELRCLAHYMSKYDGGEYTKALLEGDIHTTNQLAAGLQTREQAKRFIYAFLYGAGDTKLGTVIGAGAAEGGKLRRRFLRQTPALKRLKEDISLKVQAQGYLKGLDGRHLHIRSEHSALNTLLQSAGALLVKQATVFLYQELSERGYAWGRDWVQVAHVHDELQLEVKPELAETIGQIAVRCFERAGEHFNFRCPITGEYRVGTSWAETH
ncbi:MAG: DNA polymerase [Candidatus Melainabacteria bacterium]|nr:DNA polymerase [Candidatus Melainabacteria bacterium]